MQATKTRFPSRSTSKLRGAPLGEVVRSSEAPARPFGFGSSKTRKDIDWGRKIFHMTGGSLIAFLYLGFDLSKTTGLWILGSIAVPFILFDFLRLTRPGLNRLVHSIFGKIMRSEEKQSLSTASWLFVAAFISVALFSREVAALGAIFVGFADPAASYFGIRFGKAKLPWGKSLEGTLGSFAAAAIAGVGFCLIFGLTHLLALAFIGALAAAIAEALPLKKIDDNFTIPVLAGLVMHLSYSSLVGLPLV